MDKIRLATIWLDGCSGCHMSFIDMDERLLDLADKVELVYSPLVDTKEFPENVDVTLIEGAISTDEDLKKLNKIRGRSKVIIAFGDCAITANVPAMRNPIGVEELMESIYVDMDVKNPGVPTEVVPTLFDRSRPLHRFVDVDMYLPGCPPSADTIFSVMSDLLNGVTPNVNELTRFGG